MQEGEGPKKDNKIIKIYFTILNNKILKIIMTDCIERVIAESGRFFGVACTTAELVTEGCRRHDVGPLAAAALGRALNGAALLAALMKDGQSVSLAFEGNGPLKKIVAEAGYDGWLRGFVAKPHAELPLVDGRLDIAQGIGPAGILTVKKNIAPGKVYPGRIPLQTSEIGEDIAWYLTQSEQTPSTLGVAVSLRPDGTIAASGGFLIQSLPPAEEADLHLLEKNIAALGSLSALLMEGTTPQEILSRIFYGIAHRKTASKPLIYQCSCTREKMEDALLTLGKEDLHNLSVEQDNCEVRCEFCRQSYLFSAMELKQLTANI